MEKKFNELQSVNSSDWGSLEGRLVNNPPSPYSSMATILTPESSMTVVSKSFTVSWGDQNTQAIFLDYILYLTGKYEEDLNRSAGELLGCFHSLSSEQKNMFTSIAPQTEGHEHVNPESVFEQYKKAVHGIKTIRQKVPRLAYEEIKEKTLRDSDFDSLASIRNIAAALGYLDNRRAFNKLSAEKQENMKRQGDMLIYSLSATSF